MSNASIEINGEITVFPISEEIADLDRIINAVAGIALDEFFIKKPNGIMPLSHILERLQEKDKDNPLLKDFLSQEHFCNKDLEELLFEGEKPLSDILDEKIIEAFEKHENVKVVGEMFFDCSIPLEEDKLSDIVIKAYVINYDSFDIIPMSEYAKRYSDLVFFSREDEKGNQTLTPLEERLYRIAAEAIPMSIDRTEDGEFVITSSYPEMYSESEDGELEYNPEFIRTLDVDEDGYFNLSDRKTKAALGYFLNEDCQLQFYAREEEVKAFYYGDGDNEYHFEIAVTDEMSDDEIKKALIIGFSSKFGWVELFDEEAPKIKGVDMKFWVAATFVLTGERKLIEVGREVFDMSMDIIDSNGNADIDKDKKSKEMYCKIFEKHFDMKADEVDLQFNELSERDIQECAFESIDII